MPTYEYACQDCRKKVSLFFLSIRQAEEEKPECPLCKGTNLSRLVSRFTVARSSGSIDTSSDEIPGLSDLENGDPKALARWMRRMSDETGEPMEPEMEGVLDRLESGEDPEKLEAEMGKDTELPTSDTAPDA